MDGHPFHMVWAQYYTGKIPRRGQKAALAEAVGLAMNVELNVI